MSLKLARAATARSVASCLIGLFFLTACTDGGQVTPARPQPRGVTRQALSVGYAATASFDAPVADPGTWQGTPIGTGSWSTSATPPTSGGPAGIGFHDTQGGVLHYLLIGSFSSPSGTFFGLVSEGQQLALGSSAINNTTLYAGIFDAATGDPVAMARSGTITLTAAGLIGGRITGTFSGILDDVPPATGCTSNLQCGANETCVSGRCVASGCTSNSQCGSGQTCQAGVCVTTGCTSNTQCASGQTCQAGQCVTTGCTSNVQCGAGQSCVGGACVTTGCTSNTQCGTGKVCQAGVCVSSGCTSSSQCASGQVCQAGQCVAPPVPCDGRQGNGSYWGNVGGLTVCSAFGRGGVSVTQGWAGFGDDGNGLSLFVLDPALEMAGAILPLTACPSGPGTVSVSNAVYWDQASSGGVTFYAKRPATSATVTYLQVGVSLEGTFSISLVGGGQLNGEFEVR